MAERKKITALITSQSQSVLISKDGLEQYVADCVIELDNRIHNQIAIRRLKIKKMRGSVHGVNEYPFVINKKGMSVLPLISLLHTHRLSSDRITSGIPDLDQMLDGKGFYVGSSILVSGSAGTGKTSIAVSLVNAASNQKTRCLYCAFEESEAQITRNMLSIGLSIESAIKSGLIKFYCSRPTLQNLELHLISIRNIIEEFKPDIIVIDPVTNLMSEGINSEIRQMLSHFVDYLKSENITSLFTAAITLESIKSNPSDEGISAMMDTWILVRDIEENGERNRGIYVLKSRGMNHSTQVREFVITDIGVKLLPIYYSEEAILTGSAKLEHTLKQEEITRLAEIRIAKELHELERNRQLMEEEIASLKLRFESESEKLNMFREERKLREEFSRKSNEEISALRSKTNSSAEKSKTRNK